MRGACAFWGVSRYAEPVGPSEVGGGSPIGGPHEVVAIGLLPDGERAVSASSDGTLRLWDLKSDAAAHRPKCHDHWVSAVAVLPDSKHAVSGSRDNTLRLWDLSTGAALRRFQDHSQWVTAVGVLPSGTRLSLARGTPRSDYGI